MGWGGAAHPRPPGPGATDSRGGKSACFRLGEREGRRGPPAFRHACLPPTVCPPGVWVGGGCGGRSQASRAGGGGEQQGRACSRAAPPSPGASAAGGRSERRRPGAGRTTGSQETDADRTRAAACLPLCIREERPCCPRPARVRILQFFVRPAPCPRALSCVPPFGASAAVVTVAVLRGSGTERGDQGCWPAQK
eukprot:gene6502-biopygen13437